MSVVNHSILNQRREQQITKKSENKAETCEGLQWQSPLKPNFCVQSKSRFRKMYLIFSSLPFRKGTLLVAHLGKPEGAF